MQEDDPTHLIGYRLVNDDLEAAKKALVALMRGLYQSELASN